MLNHQNTVQGLVERGSTEPGHQHVCSPGPWILALHITSTTAGVQHCTQANTGTGEYRMWQIFRLVPHHYILVLQYYVQVEQYGSSNSREHACCIYIVSSHVSALVWAWSEERGMLRLSEAGGSHDQTSRQKNKTIQHPAWISGGRRCLRKIWLKRFANVPKKCKQMALIWIWPLPTPRSIQHSQSLPNHLLLNSLNSFGFHWMFSLNNAW